MAQNEYDFDDDDEYMDDNAIAQVRKAHKAANRRIKELEQELASFRVETRKRSVESVLTSRGYNAKIADLIPEDLTNADQIAAWLDERSDVFAPVTTGGVESTLDEQMQNQQPVQVPPGMQQFSEVVNAGQAPTGDESQILAMIQSAKNPEELNRLIFGNPHGPLAS